MERRIRDILAIEAKRHSPIRGDPDGPLALAVAAERMKPQPGDIHVHCGPGSVQDGRRQPSGGCENPNRPNRPRRKQPAGAAGSPHPRSLRFGWP